MDRLFFIFPCSDQDVRLPRSTAFQDVRRDTPVEYGVGAPFLTEYIHGLFDDLVFRQDSVRVSSRGGDGFLAVQEGDRLNDPANLGLTGRIFVVSVKRGLCEGFLQFATKDRHVSLAVRAVAGIAIKDRARGTRQVLLIIDRLLKYV